MILEGTVLAGPEYDPLEGQVVVEDDEVVAVEAAVTDSTDIVVPAFVNAHTHVGDSIAKEAGGDLSLGELVAPPDGLKHRLLRAASHEEKVAAMRRSLRFMERGGTMGFVDFRENGVEGVEALRAAAEGLDIVPFVMARGSVAAMEAGDGYGASGARDAEYETERNAARRADKPFAIHAGERDALDVNPALDLDPDHLVHMVHANRVHMERLADREPPVVVCPRSNLVTGVGLPPVRELLDRTSVALGTDNVFLNAPSMFREMEFTAKLCDVSAREVLRMATRAGAELAGWNCGIIEPGRSAKLLVLDGGGDNLRGVRDPVRAVVRRAGVDDVSRVVL